jgi:hypothetical protein
MRIFLAGATGVIGVRLVPLLVLRYGKLYGPGTYFEGEAPSPPRIHVDEAARRTVSALKAPSGVLTVVED